jgi:glycosyltransferase involved in cell wall biosynthesis
MARFVPLAIESVLSQTIGDLELHVIDDGSTDGTDQTLKKFATDRRVKLHLQKHRGKAAAVNEAIRASEGVYVAFLDADDVWMQDKLEKQVPLFATSDNIGVVYSRFTYIDEHGRSLPTPTFCCYSGRITARLFVENFVGYNTAVVRRDCLDATGMFDESLSMGVDYDLWLRMSTRFEFSYLNESTIHYRIWSGQMSRNYEKRHEYDVKIKKKFLDQHPDLVDRSTVNEAWAHTYVERGKCRAESTKKRWMSVSDYVHALTFVPTYAPAWKAIAKGLLAS